ncbi:MAG: hypothetical protein EXR05_07820 [Acetobacteraceae bacterium]|nr:hypothetical protein [Acetobacteraceae bacterium]
MTQFRRLTTPLLLLMLAGCQLIDRTFFGADPTPGPAVATNAPTPTRSVPLLSIGYPPSPVFQDALAVAVRAAEQRRPGGEYDVVSVSTAAEATQTGRDAAAVMTAMMHLGVASTRIHLSAQINAAQAVREVRVHLH